MTRTLLVLGLVALLGAGSFGQEAAKPKKRPPAHIEDCLPRAIKLARERENDSKVVRVTVVPSEGLDYDSMVAVIEYENGDVSLFQGYSDPAQDRMVALDGPNVDMLGEAVQRAKFRRH